MIAKDPFYNIVGRDEPHQTLGVYKFDFNPRRRPHYNFPGNQTKKNEYKWYV